MISRAMKSRTDEHTVCGRPTLKDVEHFQIGSVCKPYERSIYERTLWVNPSRIMLSQMSSQILILIKRIFRSVIVRLEVMLEYEL